MFFRHIQDIFFSIPRNPEIFRWRTVVFFFMPKSNSRPVGIWLFRNLFMAFWAWEHNYFLYAQMHGNRKRFHLVRWSTKLISVKMTDKSLINLQNYTIIYSYNGTASANGSRLQTHPFYFTHSEETDDGQSIDQRK